VRRAPYFGAAGTTATHDACFGIVAIGAAAPLDPAAYSLIVELSPIQMFPARSTATPVKLDPPPPLNVSAEPILPLSVTANLLSTDEVCV